MWMVQLLGDSFDLHTLSLSITGDDCKIEKDGSDYMLTSNCFTCMDKPEEVRKKANEIVILLNGASNLSLKSKQPISICSIKRLDEDGNQNTYITVDPIKVQLRVMTVTTIEHAGGTTDINYPADKVKDWISLKNQGEGVTKVLRLFSRESFDWGTIYKILEIIEKDIGGLKVIASNKWATLSSLDDINHTANDPKLSGDDARHGVQNNGSTPKGNGISISKAQSIIRVVAEKWLNSKCT